MKIKSVFLLVFVSLNAMEVLAQKPKIMIIPADIYCQRAGATMSFDNDGSTKTVSDYEKLFGSDSEINNVIAKIEGLYADRGFQPINLRKQIDKVAKDRAINEVKQVSMSPIVRILSVANPDIGLYLDFEIKKIGPKNYATFTIQAIDSYSMKTVASQTGEGPPNFDATPGTMLEAAVLEHIENLNATIEAHFAENLANGREITVKYLTDDNSSLGLTDMVTSKTGKEMELKQILKGAIIKLDHVNSKGVTCTGDDRQYTCDQVRMPISFMMDTGFEVEETNMTAEDFGGQIRDLMSSAFGVESESISYGLGEVRITIR